MIRLCVWHDGVEVPLSYDRDEGFIFATLKDGTELQVLFVPATEEDPAPAPAPDVWRGRAGDGKTSFVSDLMADFERAIPVTFAALVTQRLKRQIDRALEADEGPTDGASLTD